MKYPLSNKKSLVIGGLYTLVVYSLSLVVGFAVALLPSVRNNALINVGIYGLLMSLSLPLSGYMIRISESLLAGDERLPGFGGLKELFLKGIKMLIVVLPYLVIYSFLFALGMVAVILSPYLILVGIPLMLAGFLVVLAGIVGVIHFAKTGSMEAGANIIFSIKLVRGSIKNLAASIAKGFVTGVIFAVTMILLITIPFSLFASYAAAQYIFMIYYAEATRA